MENKNVGNVLSAGAGNGGPVRIWLVDDSDSIRCLLAEFLSGETDFECAGQFDSAEAMLDALAHETPPDVILLDVNMRGISGLEAIRPIRAIASSTRVLIMTALSDWDVKTQAIRNGASGFLLKRFPLSIPEHIRLAVAAPLPVADEVEAMEAGNDALSLNRRASEAEGVAQSDPKGVPGTIMATQVAPPGAWRPFFRGLLDWMSRPIKLKTNSGPSTTNGDDCIRDEGTLPACR
jgi:DNA-binding NarL/FixJ family response regulator